MLIQISGGGVEGRSLNVDAQKRINMFWEPDAGSARKGAYVNTPGLSLFATAGTGPIRGLHAYNGKLYAVSADTLYEISTAGTATSRGTLSTSSGSISMADNGANNGHQLMIVDGANGYIFDSSATSFDSISDANFPGGDQVVFHDSYFIVNKPNSGRFYLSSGYDGMTWTPAAFGTAESSPDELVGIAIDHNILQLYGSLTKELWWDAGNVDFTYQRVQSGVLERGCLSGPSIAKIDNGVAWLSADVRGSAQVVLSRGGQEPTIISSPQLEYVLHNYSDVGDCFAYVFQQAGAEFYVLTFPTDNETWVWNARTQQWHNWSSHLSSAYSRHRSSCYAALNSKQYVGDYSDGKIYSIDVDTYQENTATIYRELDGIHIQNERERIFIRQVEVNCEMGVGNGIVAAPTMTLQWSKDFGNTYSTGTSATLGGTSAYDNRAVFRRLGQARDWVFKLTMSDAVKFVVLDMNILLRK